jgi:hypothetical protein
MIGIFVLTVTLHRFASETNQFSPLTYFFDVLLLAYRRYEPVRVLASTMLVLRLDSRDIVVSPTPNPQPGGPGTTLRLTPTL